ncbi:MAG TPA: penicillin-binding transpeptidase domain-containing protein [Anaerolineales bacterium]|nr:penicillin-binding transpeptidase domain-containing protein [Anaerolineales bacterium]HNO31120.1 penicillin-binding transpeptidase domain-containing protein [Anaerolineales bacterium]
MKSLRWIHLLLLFILISACTTNGQGGPITNIFSPETPTSILPTAQAQVTPAPDARAAVTAFLEALQKDDFEVMYNLLAQSSRDVLTLEDFSKRWNNSLNEMSATSIEFTILSSQLSPRTAEVGYSITYKTALAGDLQRNIVMRLANEDNNWKVEWDDALILPELAGGNLLAMEYSIPARGDIYDREGLPIATQSKALAFGIQTDQIDLDLRSTLTTELGLLCGIDPIDIENQIDASGPGWYLPMCEGMREDAQRLISINPGGLVISEYESRYYAKSGLAPQAVGYTQPINPEQYNEYRRMGYQGTERIGQIGIEQWGEDYLAGKHGGVLRVVSPTGQVITTLGQSDRQAADSIYLTLDTNMQKWAQAAIQYYRGAVVVMEVDTGRILAMASGPGYDPNYFETDNPNNIGLGNLVNDGRNPMINRAAQGQLPLGSVFKVITFSAALESGLYLKDTTYDCQYDFTELPDQIRHDWTYQHCQDRLAAGLFCDTSDSRPSGLLTLQEGLMRSCNPYFWHIGNDLYTNWNRGNDIANTARAFGLGSPTGIQQIPEEAGQIIDPATDIDAVNQAIGQGTVLVTPLQVVRFMAAIANGGTLYRPQIVEKIQPVDGIPLQSFKPEAQGTLPLRAENLDILREALRMVTEEPRGTARFNLRGLQFTVLGKTGTAESGNGKPHGWFAGYTDNEANTGLPDIAIVAVGENIGEGSEFAVPIFRAMVETYYYGSPQRQFYDFGQIGYPPYTPTPPGNGIIP